MANARMSTSSWILTAAFMSLAAGAACKRSSHAPGALDAGMAASEAANVVCMQQPEGCVYCLGPEGQGGAVLRAENARMVCEPGNDDNCVEFCSSLAPECALPWSKTEGCVLDEIEFHRAVFNRETADRPEVVLYGRVVDEGARRIEGAKVRVWLAYRSNLTPLVDETSGKDGTFRIRLRSGPWSYVVRVSRPGFATEVVERLAAEKLESAPTAPRVFRLAPDLEVRGRVVDTATGAPVDGARVAAVRGGEDVIEVADTVSAEDGGFVLEGLGARRYVLRVSKFGWRQVDVKAAVAPPSPRAIVKLARATVIRGLVRDAAGQPEPGATVHAVLSGIAGTTVLGATNAEGGFALDQLKAGTYYLWARRGEMLVYPPEKIELPEQEAVDVVLTLNHKGARVSGRVRPRPGFTPSPAMQIVLLSRSPLALPRARALESTGKFVVTGVLPGRYDLSIRDGDRTLSVLDGPREVDVPIEPNSGVVLKDAIVVRPQSTE